MTDENLGDVTLLENANLDSLEIINGRIVHEED